MKNISQFILTLVSSLLCVSASNAVIPNHDNPNIFLGPSVKGSFTNPITNSIVYSLAGEAGVKNIRVGGTLGFRIDQNQRLKLSIEYLWQDITYAFFSGNTDQWVNQGAVGGDYEYLIDYYTYKPTFDLSAYYSHAQSKSLGTRFGAFVNRFGVPLFFIDERRIAGSNAGGVEPGVTITPWLGGRFGLALNYDNVRYDTRLGRGKNANGFGGTAHLSQLITDNVEIGGSAAARQPYNYYSAYIAWMNVSFYGKWTLGLYGAYTTGKSTLPNTYNAGISADYFFEPCPPARVHLMNLKGDLKNEAPPILVKDDFMAWTSDPGVHMPQVLAVTDPKLTLIIPQASPTPTPQPPVCDLIPPSVVGTIAPIDVIPPSNTDFASANAFSPGTGLIYSINVSPAPQAGNSITINPTTGVITVVARIAANFTATVTATNACGSAITSAPFTIFVEQA